MPEKNQYLYMDDGGPDEIPELTAEDEEFIKAIEDHYYLKRHSNAKTEAKNDSSGVKLIE